MIIKLLKKLKDILSQDYWVKKIDNKTGLNDWAMKSPIRKWALGLTGWKWWFYQIVVCGIMFIILECLFNLIGITMLPWK